MQRRAALAVLCVFAVALSASLFPAGGFGSAPSGVATGGPVDAPSDADARTPVGSGSSETTADTETATTNDGSDDSTSTTAATTTATTTGSASSAGASGGGIDPFVVLSTLIALLGGFVVVGFWTGVLGLSARTVGPIPVTVTVAGTPVGELIGSVPTRTMALVVGLSASVPRVLDDASALTRAVGGTLSTVLAGVARGTGDALRIGARGLGATLAAAPRALAGLGAGASVLSSLGSVSLPRLGRRTRDRRNRRSGASASTDAAAPADDSPPTVEEAWDALTERVPVRNRETRTPGEVARAAVDRGYPEDAVRRLTDAFREVRYGGLSRSDRTDAARDALDRLRNHWGDRK